MSLKFLFVVVLVYGTWELIGNETLLLHNNISFIAGVIVATAVLMILTVFQIFIRYTLDTSFKQIHHIYDHFTPNLWVFELAKSMSLYFINLVEHAKHDNTKTKNTDSIGHKLDVFTVAVILCKLLLTWNSNSAWSESQLYFLRVFFVLLFIVHLVANFIAIAEPIVFLSRDCKCFNDYKQRLSLAIAVCGSFWIAALMNSDVIDLILNDPSTSFSVYASVLVEKLVQSITLAICGFVGAICCCFFLPKQRKAEFREDWSLYILVSFMVFFFVAVFCIDDNDIYYYAVQFTVVHTNCALFAARGIKPD